jgi:hypothetical protein
MADPSTQPPSKLSVEKSDSNQLDNAPDSDGANMIEIDPVVEKRVLRKMDKAIIPLVTALCKHTLPA